MNSKGIIIIVAVGIVAFWFYNSKRKKNNNNSEIATSPANKKNISGTTNLSDKERISEELDKIEAKHLPDFINYFITLFADSELDNQTDRNSIAEIYPNTMSRQLLDFTRLFRDYDVKIVNESILEKLFEKGLFNFEPEINEPFLKFELMVEQEAELEARRIFDEFFKR